MDGKDGNGLADSFESAPAELLGSICLHHLGSLGCVHNMLVQWSSELL